MLRGLWFKFFILLISVSLIALSSAFLLRELMIKDFRQYLEGTLEDKVYQITADLEGAFEKYKGWNKDVVAEKMVQAFLSGLELRLRDEKGEVIMDIEKAFEGLTPLMKRRVLALSGDWAYRKSSEPFTPYPLFLGGREIGSLEIRFMKTMREERFVQRSNILLLIALACLGGLSVILSIILSRRLTAPIKALSKAAESLKKGNYSVKVPVGGKDEIASLSEAFNSMVRALEIQENLRKTLISNVAHELRTPLGAIRGSLEAMMDGLIPPDNKELEFLYEEVQRLSRIVEGIEELTRAQMSSLNLKRENILLKPFLEEIINLYRKGPDSKNISMELSTDDNMTIYADPERLSQIIVNLLSNSIKAVKGNGRIWIKAGTLFSPVNSKREIFMEFGDTGCGIKEDELPFIFERFYRRFNEGLGIGLSIVKELVEAHGGRIEVKSEYGKGTTFMLYFPASDLHNSS
jgi:two-component system sensor histidine kinase BaeS